MSNDEIKVSKAQIRKIMESSTDEVKSVLVDLVGKEIFEPTITERIKGYLEACTELGEVPHTAEAYGHVKAVDLEKVIAFHELLVITRALNEGWVLSPKNIESAFMPVFAYKIVNTQRIFYFAGSEQITGRYVGCSLALKNRELSDYAGKSFTHLYEKI